jgi:DNA polymerase
MRAALTAITEELQRLKAAGVRSVNVSEEGLRRLHRLSEARNSAAAAAAVVVAVGPEASSVTAAPPAVPGTAVAKSPPLPPAPPVPLPDGSKRERWEMLRNLVLQDPVCGAHVRPGKQVVFGVGSIDAAIMFVGEAPGAEEEVQGEPFVGPAGQLLTKMILGMGLKREEVYIGNIMNWRPQLPGGNPSGQVGNRPPTEDEMRYCLPYLRAQIEVVNPRLLVALGKTAAEGLLGFRTFKALGEVRGRWHEFAGRPLMVTYHPSYILREPTNRKKRMIWEDLLMVMERAELPVSPKQRGYFLEK